MQTASARSEPGWVHSRPWLGLVATAAFLAVLSAPQVHGQTQLRWTFVGVGAVLAAWAIALGWAPRRGGRRFHTVFTAVKSHWVQAAVQASILCYWGAYVPAVLRQVPLIVGQVLYMYAFDALLSWSRGRTWRLGFGPLPIVFSTNLLLWFKPEWFAFQFVMLTLGALGKNFVTWEREGRRTHVFNPSAFGQFLVAIVLIATGLTKELTLGKEIAASFEVPHMLLVIFLGGLIVQYFFAVTLMTLSAACTLCVFGLVYHWIYGTYWFVNVNVAATIFLGIHLLLTDPATSPRTHLGRVLFGAAYALAYAAMFRLLDTLEVPTFWDKLLPVPILNLCVPAFDSLARRGWVGRIQRVWEEAWSPKRANLAHMGTWIVVFGAWVGLGFVEGPHEGDSIPFWKRAVAEHKSHAGHSLVMAAGALAEGHGVASAYNELGLICLEGKLVEPNHPRAAEFFAKASDLGDPHGAMNVVAQFLFFGERLSDADLERAFVRLERLCDQGFEGPACWLLGYAHEVGRGRPRDLALALRLYMRCDVTNPYAAKGIVRIGFQAPVPRRILA